MSRPRIGLTLDLEDGRINAKANYVRAIVQAGGHPVPLAPLPPDHVSESLQGLDAIVLTGGDDPHMQPFGLPQHPASTTIAIERQTFEWALLDQVLHETRLPVLGICLGMQWMGLMHGGALHQHLPDHIATAALHEGNAEHPIEGAIGHGLVTSRHHQALADPGSLEVIAKAPDQVIEAVRLVDHPFRLGVQWHPERTTDHALGQGLFDALLEHVRA